MQMAASENFRTNLQQVVDSGRVTKWSLAQRAEASRSYLDAVLKGETEPGLAKAEKLANAAGFTLITMLEAPEAFSEAIRASVSA
jgi:hypothetical protein